MTDGQWGRIHQTPLGAGEEVMGRVQVTKQGLSFPSALPFLQQDPGVSR